MTTAESAVAPVVTPTGQALWPRRWLSSRLFDLLSQQLVWWCAVGLVRFGHSELAALPAVGLVAVAAWARGLSVLALAGLGVGIGFAVDASLIQIGTISLPGGLDLGLAASWLLGLWAAFGVGFGASLRGLLDRSPVLAFVLGGPAGILAYRAGDSLGVLTITINDGPWPLLTIGVAWAVAMTALRVGASLILRRGQVRA